MTHAFKTPGSGIVPVLTDGQRLMLARTYVGLTQGQIAERLGVTTATVQRSESGQTKPRRTTFMAWSMATGIDLHWLETGHAPESGACALCAIRDLNPEPADSFFGQVIDLFPRRPGVSA